MSVKITSIITIISSVTVLAAALISAVIWFNMFERHNALPMSCTAMIYINSGESKERVDIPRASLKFVFHVQDDLKMHVTEYGTIKYQGKEYLLDRVVKLTVSPKTQNGYHEVTRNGIVSNLKENVPASLIEHLVSSQPILFYKIEKIDSDTWKISDQQRTIFVCRR